MDECTVFVVEDDAGVRSSIAILLRSDGLRVRTFASAKEVLNLCPDESDRGCLVVDLRLPEMTGVELRAELVSRGCHLPFIVVSGACGVTDAKEAIRQGAVDFLEKPVSRADLLQAVHQAIEHDRVLADQRAQYLAFRAKLAALTAREKQVMELVVAGRLTKQIASELQVAQKTIEVHRSNITKKMKVQSVIELVKQYTEFTMGEQFDS